MVSDVLRSSLRGFGTSIFSTITQQAVERGAINPAQGFPDFDPPEQLLQAAAEALHAGTSTRRAPVTRCCGGRSPPT
ncbi:MAG TPA: hypothetical protein VEL73_10275, partial [Mycobacteriales bacterium]|nr:hypothetical protein [Mycobacteriales bacterium]